MPHGMAWRGAAVETFRRTAEGPWPVRPSTASTASGQRPAASASAISASGGQKARFAALRGREIGLPPPPAVRHADMPSVGGRLARSESDLDQ